MSETQETEANLEGKCGSCKWLTHKIPSYDEEFEYDILAAGGTRPIPRCGNFLSQRYKDLVSPSRSTCGRYSKKDS